MSTWDSVYNWHLKRGSDHGAAAFSADQWEQRQRQDRKESRIMKLSELIAEYGDDKVQFQKLDDCADRLNMNGGTTQITFGTPERIGPDGTVKLGLVVWMDRDRVAEIIAAQKP